MDRRTMLVGSVAIGTGLMTSGWRKVLAQGESSGWQPLFDGNSLDGWTFYQEGVGTTDRLGAVSVEDGVLHFLGPRFKGDEAPSGHIATTAEWSNFHLRLDYRWGLTRFPPRTLQRRNSGILYHMAPDRDRLFPDCVEFQVEESDVGDAIMINTMALQGPVLGGTPLWPNYLPFLPREYEEPVQAGGIARQWFRHAGHFERLDEWNTLDLYAFDDQAAHLVNGRIVNTLYAMIRSDAAGNRVRLTSGRIALELEQAEILFRNVMIRRLSDASIERIRETGSD